MKKFKANSLEPKERHAMIVGGGTMGENGTITRDWSFFIDGENAKPNQPTKSELRRLIVMAKHEIGEWSKFQKTLEKELKMLDK